ncbi:hypothetical protein [Dehalobacter sp. TBBPA1]|uniref:hypothetical protein n=1 Tax=Dehalobacter sp. TBBPA1 TaxID=3235037 RepID=UPI0034A1F433
MKEVKAIILILIIFICSACTSNHSTSQSTSTEQNTTPTVGASNDILALRGEYFDFSIKNRLDYVPFFDEGKAPTTSVEYLFYAFAINLYNWGDDKGIMTREYVEQVIQTHFDVKEITHESMRKGWDYDGKKYIAVPQGIKEEPIYVLQKYETYNKNGLTIYKITLDYCSFHGLVPTEEDMANIRANIGLDNLSSLTVLQKECFQYYIDKKTEAIVFISHNIVN